MPLIASAAACSSPDGERVGATKLRLERTESRNNRVGFLDATMVEVYSAGTAFFRQVDGLKTDSEVIDYSEGGVSEFGTKVIEGLPGDLAREPGAPDRRNVSVGASGGGPAPGERLRALLRVNDASGGTRATRTTS